MPKIRPAHYLLGIEGVALVREWMRGGEEVVAPRVDELVRMAADYERSTSNISLDVPEMDVPSGYAAWASNYDVETNPLIAAEEPAVRALIDRFPPGEALDAASGTGRHTRYLQSRGHRVVAIDLTIEMLNRARAKAPQACFCIGDLASLPLSPARFDLAVCSLALTHLPALARPIAELASAVRSGGWVIVSVFHPMNALLGGGAFFQGGDGRFGLVRGFYHDHAEYVSAFIAAGFEIRECVEPRWGAREIAMIPIAAAAPEAFRAALSGTPLALIWLVSRR